MNDLQTIEKICRERQLKYTTQHVEKKTKFMDAGDTLLAIGSSPSAVLVFSAAGQLKSRGV